MHDTYLFMTIHLPLLNRQGCYIVCKLFEEIFNSIGNKILLNTSNTGQSQEGVQRSHSHKLVLQLFFSYESFSFLGFYFSQNLRWLLLKYKIHNIDVFFYLILLIVALKKYKFWWKQLRLKLHTLWQVSLRFSFFG